MTTRRQEDDYVRQHERNDNTRKIGLLTDLKDTNARLADITTKLHAVDEKLQPAGAALGPLPIAGEMTHAKVTIVRKIGEEWRKLAVDEDTVLMPGDTVEARFDSGLESVSIQ
jgi:polysaccharide export outer membrane protein